MTAELVGVLFVAVAATIGGLMVREARQRRRDAVLLGLLSSFGPAVAAAKQDPHDLVAWSEVAQTARSLFPNAFQRLDSAAGGRFPFSGKLIEATHARWTADWLAFERQHDLEYKRRSADAEAEALASGIEEGEGLRTRLAAITQEKFQTYQDRYEQYVRVGKAIAALGESPHPAGGDPKSSSSR